MRNAKILNKSDSHDIEDITSTNYIMVDSIDRVIQAHNEIRRAVGHSATEDLSFLAKWNHLSLEEKHKKYSQFVCHEVNLFIFFKDPDYFKTVVRPFISNKMEKSFIDLWLVGDHDAVVKYKQLELHDRLNTLEKCLLISEVVKDSKEDAQAIADRIKLLSDQKELKIDVVNRIIDTVINLNMTQDQAVSAKASQNTNYFIFKLFNNSPILNTKNTYLNQFFATKISSFSNNFRLCVWQADFSNF